jgi:Immunity protein family (Imm11)
MNNRYPYWIVVRDSNRFRSFNWNETKRSRDEWSACLDRMREGKSLAEIWKPPELSLYYDEEVAGGGEDLPVSDFMNGILSISLNSKARAILEPLILDQVEFLPLPTSIGDYFEMNVRQINCLDVPNSVVERFRSSDRIMHVQKYAFFTEKLAGVHLFFAAELGINPLFASEEFRQAVEANGLTGLLFMEIPQ